MITLLFIPDFGLIYLKFSIYLLVEKSLFKLLEDYLMSNKLSVAIKKTAITAIAGSAFLYISFAQAGYFTITLPELSNFNNFISQKSLSERYSPSPAEYANCPTNQKAAWRLNFVIPTFNTQVGTGQEITVYDNNGQYMHGYTFSLKSSTAGGSDALSSIYTLSSGLTKSLGINENNPRTKNYFISGPSFNGKIITITGRTNSKGIFTSIQINIPDFSFKTALPLNPAGSSIECPPKSDAVTYKVDNTADAINVADHNITGFTGCTQDGNRFKCSFNSTS